MERWVNCLGLLDNMADMFFDRGWMKGKYHSASLPYRVWLGLEI